MATKKSNTKKPAAKKPAAKKSPAKPAAATAPKQSAPAKQPSGGIVKPLICAIVICVVIVVALIGAMFLIDNAKKNDRTGKYTLQTIVTDGTVTTESMETLASLGLTATLELGNKGSCKANLFGRELVCTYDDKNINFDNEDHAYTFADQKITLKYGESELVLAK